MTWNEIKARVQELDIFDAIDSRPPMLSKPVLFSMDDNWYVVYMLYDFYYEDVPDGFCVFDPKSGKAAYMDAHDGRNFLGIPDAVYQAPVPKDHSPEYVREEELEELFNDMIKEGTPDRAGYLKYLFRVMDSAKAEGRNFYAYFG